MYEKEKPIVRLLVRLALILAILTSAFAAQSAEKELPRVSASYLSTEPTLDGYVENDPAWRHVKPLTTFTQQMPSNGEPATMPMHVFVGYTDTDLHLAWIVFEDDINNMAPLPKRLAIGLGHRRHRSISKQNFRRRILYQSNWHRVGCIDV